MGKHRHRYNTLFWWTLTLPDFDRYYEVIITWECRGCGDILWATGTFHQTAQAMSPEAWQRLAEQERRKGSALGHAAVREERHHALATDKYDAFARRTS